MLCRRDSVLWYNCRKLMVCHQGWLVWMNIPFGRVTKATDGFVCRLPIGVTLTVVVTSVVFFFVFAPRDCQTWSDQMLP